jgi:hypothetical protein
MAEEYVLVVHPRGVAAPTVGLRAFLPGGFRSTTVKMGAIMGGEPADPAFDAIIERWENKSTDGLCCRRTGSVGLTIGFIFGSFSILRYVPGPCSNVVDPHRADDA